MDIFLGFLLGLLTSAFSEAALALLKTKFPRAADSRVLLALVRPVRYFRHRRRGREPLAVINRLFAAWEAKDEAAYRECWHPDATMIVGDYSQRARDLDQIMAGFRASCARYASIKVDYVTKESIDVAPDGTKAKVDVRYGFTVERPDALEVREQGRDRYGLLLVEGKWAVASNWDRSDVS